jgi:hypothetical protein
VLFAHKQADDNADAALLDVLPYVVGAGGIGEGQEGSKALHIAEMQSCNALNCTIANN